MTSGSRVTRTLKILSGVLALGCWFSWFFLWKYFDAHKPDTPEPSKGMIYPLNTHGSIVYITQNEHYALYGLIVAAIAFFLLVVVFRLIETKKY